MCPKGDPNFRCLRRWSPEKAGDHRGVSEPFLKRHVTAEISKVALCVLIIWFDIIWYIDLTWCECVFFLTCYMLLFAKASQRWQSHSETVRMRHTMDSLSPALQQTLQTESVGSLVRVTLCDNMWHVLWHVKFEDQIQQLNDGSFCSQQKTTCLKQSKEEVTNPGHS